MNLSMRDHLQFMGIKISLNQFGRHRRLRHHRHHHHHHLAAIDADMTYIGVHPWEMSLSYKFERKWTKIKVFICLHTCNYALFVARRNLSR